MLKVRQKRKYEGREKPDYLQVLSLQGILEDGLKASVASYFLAKTAKNHLRRWRREMCGALSFFPVLARVSMASAFFLILPIPIALLGSKVPL